MAVAWCGAGMTLSTNMSECQHQSVPLVSWWVTICKVLSRKSLPYMLVFRTNLISPRSKNWLTTLL